TLGTRQGALFLAYAPRQRHPILAARLSRSKECAKDRPRRKAAGVPPRVQFRTRQQLALEMLDGCGGALPHAWVAGDDEMGRPSGFRRDLRGRGERYLLGVPSDTVIRDLDVPPPEYAGSGRRPKTPFARLDRWRSGGREGDWAGGAGGGGEEGPLVVRAVKRRER